MRINAAGSPGACPRCPFHKYTTSSPGFFLGAPRSSVASGAGLEPGVPRGALAQDLRNGHLGVCLRISTSGMLLSLQHAVRASRWPRPRQAYSPRTLTHPNTGGMGVARQTPTTATRRRGCELVAKREGENPRTKRFAVTEEV